MKHNTSNINDSENISNYISIHEQITFKLEHFTLMFTSTASHVLQTELS